MVVANSAGEEVRDLCRWRDIKQEITTADTPQFDGVGERVLVLIEIQYITEDSC